MGLESGSFISNLQISNPTTGDPVSQGDDHLRLIKSVLKTQFPGSSGTGFSKAIIATEDEINYLDGVTSNIQSQINAASSSIPAGTRMLFVQYAPPAGWTLVTDFADHMLRIVNTTGGGYGGVDSPILNSKVYPHTHAASGSSVLTVNNNSAAHAHYYTTNDPGNHSHTYSRPRPSGATWEIGSYSNLATESDWASGGAGAHTHAGWTDNTTITHNHSGSVSTSVSVSANTGNNASDWRPRHVNAIICQKV